MSLASRKLIQAAGGAGVDTGDDDFANVVLLLDGDGTSGDANNTFTDSSTNGFTVTESGSVVQGSFSPYGNNWSNRFDGNSDALTITDSTDFDFGTGDFTMEAWVYPTDLTDTYNYPTIVSAHEGTDNTTWIFAVSSTNKLVAYGGGSGIQTSTSDVPLNDWSHVMITRSSGTIRFFINGTLDASTYTSTGNYNASTAGIAIGKQPVDNGGLGVTRYWQGWISNVRLIKGTALHTSSFTPSTSPLTAVTNTVLLACQSNRFIDNSSSSHTLTPTGTVAVTPFSPFKDSDARDITTDGGSMYGDGSGDYLQVAYSSDLSTASGDFTIECWVYLKDLSVNNQFFYFGDTNRTTSNASGIAYGLLFSSSSGIGFNAYYGATSGFSYYSSTSIQANQWYHVSACRNGSNFYLSINGNVESAGSFANNLNNSTSWVLRVGKESNSVGRDINGYISDARLVKGSALYTSNFTPSTSPLTAITNTALLLNFQDAGIYDRSGINNIDTVGNAQIDTAVKKYGTGSMEFDGTGDYLRATESTPTMGTGAFTWECWCYITTSGSYQCLIDTRTSPSSGSSTGMALLINTGTYTPIAATTTTILTSSINVTQNSWTHVALTRSTGGTLTLWVNGQSGGSTSNSTNLTDSALWIGGNNTSPYPAYVNGYLDDLRITKGVARYTANFTPPDAALPKF